MRKTDFLFFPQPPAERNIIKMCRGCFLFGIVVEEIASVVYLEGKSLNLTGNRMKSAHLTNTLASFKRTGTEASDSGSFSGRNDDSHSSGQKRGLDLLGD